MSDYKKKGDRLNNPHDGTRKRGQESHKAKHKYSRNEKHKLSKAEIEKILAEIMEADENDGLYLEE